MRTDKKLDSRKALKCSHLGKAQRGFTVIEVMMVLGVAALIMLAVFVAVPGMQRAQRNNARQKDVTRMISAIAGFVGNNSGNVPTASADVTTIINDVGTLGGYPTTLSVAGTLATAASGKVSLVAAGGAAVGALSTSIIDGMQIVTGATCSGTGATGVGASAKNIALEYTLETSSSTVSAPYCKNVQ